MPGDFATIAKLSRILMLAPVIIALGLMHRMRHGGQRVTKSVPMPWFVFGFIALVGLNSVITIPHASRAVIVTATTFLLSVALAAMGLETDVRKVWAKGLRPLFLALGAFLFISGFSLMLVWMTV